MDINLWHLLYIVGIYFILCFLLSGIKRSINANNANNAIEVLNEEDILKDIKYLPDTEVFYISKQSKAKVLRIYKQPWYNSMQYSYYISYNFNGITRHEWVREEELESIP